jgi:predicted DsbA family dithiol-disulfide isomerase
VTTIEPVKGPVSVIVVSDFVCPWCYIGLVAVERLQREYDVEIRHAPYFLDPTTPPEGKPRKPQMRPDDPPSRIEAMGAELGLKFARGRTWTSNSHLALEAAEFAAETPYVEPFFRAMFKAYFEDLVDIGQVDTVVRIGEGAGLDGPALRRSLESGEYRAQVDSGIEWARRAGVTGVPTYIIDDRWAVVGAQDYPVFDSLMKKLGKVPRSAES